MTIMKCVRVSSGLRSSEKTVTFTDAKTGIQDYLRVDDEFIMNEGGEQFIPVYFLGIDDGEKLALIELPQESERGNNRIWVRQEDIRNKTLKAQPA